MHKISHCLYLILNNIHFAFRSRIFQLFTTNLQIVNSCKLRTLYSNFVQMRVVYLESCTLVLLLWQFRLKLDIHFWYWIIIYFKWNLAYFFQRMNTVLTKKKTVSSAMNSSHFLKCSLEGHISNSLTFLSSARIWKSG